MDDYTASNRALWDEWTTIHERSVFYDLEGWRSGRRRDRIPRFVLDEVGDVTGKDLLHLQCHFGLDSLEWARRGARVTGVDFSERAIALARSLAAEEAGLEAAFVQADVLDPPAWLNRSFDVVFTSFGVLWWLRDLARWAEVIAGFLRPGGFLYVADFHPFVMVLDDDEGVTEPRPRYPYFPSPEPLAFPVQGSYADRDAEVKHEVEYGWQHSIGEIVTVVAQAGMRVEFLHEFPFSVEQGLPFLVRSEGTDPRRYRLPGGFDGTMPLLCSLKALG